MNPGTTKTHSAVKLRNRPIIEIKDLIPSLSNAESGERIEQSWLGN